MLILAVVSGIMHIFNGMTEQYKGLHLHLSVPFESLRPYYLMFMTLVIVINSICRLIVSCLALDVLLFAGYVAI